MAVVVVGGQTRNIGKTTLCQQILRVTAPMRWTAIKVTAHSHGVGVDVSGVGQFEEMSRVSGTDTSRMLAAGAQRSLLLHAEQVGALGTLIASEIEIATNTLIESNSVLELLRPDLAVAVVDPERDDFKPSLSRWLDRMDAFFVRGQRHPDAASWPGVAKGFCGGKPCFAMQQDDLSAEARTWIEGRLAGGLIRP